MGQTGEKGNAANAKIEPEITKPFGEHVATAPKSVKQRYLIIETEKTVLLPSPPISQVTLRSLKQQ